MKKLIIRNSLLAPVLLVFGMSIGSYVNAHSTATTYKTVQVNGLDIFYREAGPKSAPTILLLHGYLTSSHMFRNLIRDLSDQYHLLAPDYPGFGRSEQPPMSEIAGRSALAISGHSLWLGGRAALAEIHSPREFVPYASGLVVPFEVTA
ncbi:MAG: alpha/beta fold hydrolase [Acidiferrobacterales bacterium]